MIGAQYNGIPHLEINENEKPFFDIIYTVYKWTFNKLVYLGLGTYGCISTPDV